MWSWNQRVIGTAFQQPCLWERSSKQPVTALGRFWVTEVVSAKALSLVTVQISPKPPVCPCCLVHFLRSPLLPCLLLTWVLEEKSFRSTENFLKLCVCLVVLKRPCIFCLWTSYTLSVWRGTCGIQEDFPALYFQTDHSMCTSKLPSSPKIHSRVLS